MWPPGFSQWFLFCWGRAQSGVGGSACPCLRGDRTPGGAAPSSNPQARDPPGTWASGPQTSQPCRPSRRRLHPPVSCDAQGPAGTQDLGLLRGSARALLPGFSLPCVSCGLGIATDTPRVAMALQSHPRFCVPRSQTLSPPLFLRTSDSPGRGAQGSQGGSSQALPSPRPTLNKVEVKR